MSTVYEFVLGLKNMMGGGFRSAIATTHTGVTAIAAEVNSMERSFEHAGTSSASSLGGMVNNLNNVGNAAREAQKQLDSMHGAAGGGGGVLGSMAGGAFIGNLGSQALMAGVRKVKDIAEEAYDNGVELENMKVGLQTFVGNRANDIVEGVLKQAVKTPFTTQALLPIEMGFISTGMTPERSNKDMMNIANAVAATGGNTAILERIGSDMMGAAASGKIQGRELMELQRTGHINMASLVAKDLYPKMPLDKALKKVDEIDITFSEFERALQRASDKGGMFEGALDRLSETVGGKASTLKDSWWNATAKAMESQSGPIKEIEDIGIKALEDLPTLLARIEPVLTPIVRDFADLAKWVYNNTETIGTWLALMKVGAEAWIAWKVGTMAMAAANWVWAASVGAEATAAGAATAIMLAENAALAEQVTEVEALALEYDQLTVSMNMMSASQKELMALQANKAFTLPVNVSGPVNSGINSGSAGWLGAVGSAVVPVAIAYFAGEALAQMLPNNPLTGDSWHLKDIVGAQFNVADQPGLALSIGKIFGYDPIKDGLNDAWMGKHKNLLFQTDAFGRTTNLPNKGGDKMLEHLQSLSAAKEQKTEETSDAIAGGGRKQIIINVNKPMYEVQHQVWNNVKEGLNDMEMKIKEVMYRTLASANQGLG